MKKGEKTVKKNTRKGRILDFLANNPGKHKTSEIARAVGLEVNSASTVLGELARDGKITKIKGGTYIGIDTQTQSPDDKLQQLSKQLRTAEDNETIISELLNEYDDLFKEWVTDKGISFEKRLERFKLLTMIGDRLLKRWALVHVGYDTNTRQAQEDAKAKTEQREKAALENAPLEDKIVVVGHYHPDMQEVLRNLPRKELDESEV